VYAVKGPGVQRLVADVGCCDHSAFLWDYWFVDADPVTIEIRFAERILYPGDAIRQLREDLAPAIIHEEGYEADRVFVRASLPPGRYSVGLWETGRIEIPRERPPGLILDRGRAFRLMYWAPGGTPEVLGDHVLPSVHDRPPFPAAPSPGREEAFFSTIVLGEGEYGVSVGLWHWQRGGRPPLRLLRGVWPVPSIYLEFVFPRGDDLIIQDLRSVTVVDSNGQRLATLVEDDRPCGTVVGPGGEIAVFLVRRDDQGVISLDLTVFSPTLGTQRTWEAVHPHGLLERWFLPWVEPIWHGNEILLLALDDRHPDRPTYNLVAFDISTGTVQHIAGPFADAWRISQTHYVLYEDLGGIPTVFDASTRSLWIQPSPTELGVQSSVFPVAANGEWIVFQWSRDRIRWSPELLAWHPADGVMPLGPGDRAFAMGEGFAWWMETPGTGD
jgi:hypothetical protein